jgi:hypothetical protein
MSDREIFEKLRCSVGVDTAKAVVVNGVVRRSLKAKNTFPEPIVYKVILFLGVCTLSAKRL